MGTAAAAAIERAARPAAARRRIVWLAVAEGRGHLMRAQLAARLLAPTGIDVDIVTTSPAGAAFLAAFGVRAEVVSTSYRLIYDGRQNLARRRTRLMTLAYFASPRRCLRDLAWLEGYAAGAALIVNDTFHPALLAAALARSSLGARVVHLHGENTRRAVEDNAGDGPLGLLIGTALRRAPQIEIGLGARAGGRLDGDVMRLPPLLPAPRPRDQVRRELGVHDGARLAVVYLNPYFRDAALAAAIEDALAAHGFALHAVGEGYAHRAGWRATDPALPDAVAAADVFLSAPGNGALALARATGVPMIALATDQPEQRKNLASSSDACRLVVEAAGDVRGQLARALAAIPATPCPNDAELAIHHSRALWLRALTSLVDRNAVQPVPEDPS